MDILVEDSCRGVVVVVPRTLFFELADFNSFMSESSERCEDCELASSFDDSLSRRLCFGELANSSTSSSPSPKMACLRFFARGDAIAPDACAASSSRSGFSWAFFFLYAFRLQFHAETSNGSSKPFVIRSFLCRHCSRMPSGSWKLSYGSQVALCLSQSRVEYHRIWTRTYSSSG